MCLCLHAFFRFVGKLDVETRKISGRWNHCWNNWCSGSSM